jgi:2,4-dienoyl-CoA reductase (NADPH2)
MGDSLGKTTGWIHRTTLQQREVTMINGVAYDHIDDDGLYVTFRGKDRVLEVDTIIICAGQEPNRNLQKEMEIRGKTVHLIGGAERAIELDAKRAIDQGVRLAAVI